jgi:hypothetical protein
MSGVLPAHPPHGPGRIAVVMIFVSVWMLAGCGMRTGADHPAAAGVSTVAPTSTASKINATELNACQGAQGPEDAKSFTPDISVTEDGDVTHMLTLHQGQRLEIRLDAQVQWRLSVVDPNHTLVSAGSQGWHDTTSNTCIWRFTAQATGDAQLVFSGTLPCPPLKVCPSSDRSAIYRLSIQ